MVSRVGLRLGLRLQGGRKLAHRIRGSRMIRGWAGKLVSRVGLRLQGGRKLAQIIRGSRVVQGWAGKVVSRNAISRITLVKRR